MKHVAALLAALAIFGACASCATSPQAGQASQPSASSAPLAGMQAACKTFQSAWQGFTVTGDLRAYLKRTDHIATAPDALQGSISKFNGDLTVYMVATKHRVSKAKITADVAVIRQNCG